MVMVAVAQAVRKMAREKAIIRSLAAIETLGSVSIVCCNKTCLFIACATCCGEIQYDQLRLQVP
jgi:hypothetical protein